MNWEPISDHVWDGIRDEFTLPAVGQVHQRLSELMEDPEPVMQQLVRVIDEGTYCPGFQFLAGGQVHPTVRELFTRAMALKIPTTASPPGWSALPRPLLDPDRWTIWRIRPHRYSWNWKRFTVDCTDLGSLHSGA